MLTRIPDLYRKNIGELVKSQEWLGKEGEINVINAKELRVNTNMAYRLINAGLLPSIKIGSTKVRPEALKEFLITYEGEDIEKCLQNMEEPK